MELGHTPQGRSPMTQKKKPDDTDGIDYSALTDEQIAAMTNPDNPGPVGGKPEAPAEVPGVNADGQPNPWAIMNRLVQAIENMQQRPAGDQNGQALEILTQAVLRLSEASIAGSKQIAEAQIKAVRPSNEVVPGISVFNRRGRDPLPEGCADLSLHRATLKPKLKCMMMVPWIAEWESLTREEVMLLNLLEEGAYSIKRVDRSKVTLTVTIRYAEDNKTPSVLFINHDTAFNPENFRNMPPMPDMYRDMLKQHDRSIAQKAAAVLSDEEEEALIEAGQLSVTL